jgi:hypothetical protein
MRTIIIGKNGTCKTTLLRCLAIGLADRKDASGLLAEDIGQLVSEGESHGTIRIATLQIPPERGAPVSITATIGKEGDQDFLKERRPTAGPVGMFVCGYGVGRSHEGPETGRPYRIIDSVYTLFQYEQPFIGAELTLRRLRDYLGEALYTKTMQGIKRILGLGRRDRIEIRKGGGVTISGPGIGRHIALSGWADGQRMMFHWLLDLYAWAMRADCVTRSGGVRGILLVDELEQHLHPSMQVLALDRLSQHFPELQIIATTHSPLITLGAHPSEVIVLRRKGNIIARDADVPDFAGYSAEDILADSRLFDSEVYSPKLSRELAEYRRLMSIPKKSQKPRQKQRLRVITRSLLKQHVLQERRDPIGERFKELVEKYDL